MARAPRFHQVTAVENHQIVCGPETIQLIEHECRAILAGGDKYKDNYSFRRLDLTGHLAFDLLMDDGKIAGWCGLYDGGRYPQGVFRVMNRLYIHPAYRSRFFAPPTRVLYRSQVQRHKDQLRLIFLSRNELKGKYHLKRWIKYDCGEPGWNLSPGLVQVAPFENRQCYQYIAYKAFTEVDWPKKILTEEEWLRLPE